LSGGAADKAGLKKGERVLAVGDADFNKVRPRRSLAATLSIYKRGHCQADATT